MGMADLMSAWETVITCQAKYNLEHNFTHLLDNHSLAVEDLFIYLFLV